MTLDTGFSNRSFNFTQTTNDFQLLNYPYRCRSKNKKYRRCVTSCYQSCFSCLFFFFCNLLVCRYKFVAWLGWSPPSYPQSKRILSSSDRFLSSLQWWIQKCREEGSRACNTRKKGGRGGGGWWKKAFVLRNIF